MKDLKQYILESLKSRFVTFNEWFDKDDNKELYDFMKNALQIDGESDSILIVNKNDDEEFKLLYDKAYYNENLVKRDIKEYRDGDNYYYESSFMFGDNDSFVFKWMKSEKYLQFFFNHNTDIDKCLNFIKKYYETLKKKQQNRTSYKEFTVDDVKKAWRDTKAGFVDVDPEVLDDAIEYAVKEYSGKNSLEYIVEIVFDKLSSEGKIDHIVA